MFKSQAAFFPAEARYVWSDDDPSLRHQYRNFRFSFSLKNLPKTESLFHIFAGTRYRLYVNGEVVGHGPTRFKKNFPYYDTHDLNPYLRKGKNSLAVTVCSYSWGTFLSDQDAGCLITWGQIGKISLATPGAWLVSKHTGYNSHTAAMSFALGMSEDQDTRLAPAGWTLPDFDDSKWQTVSVLDKQTALEARPIPNPEEIPDRLPQRITAFAVTRPKEKIFSTYLASPGGGAPRAHDIALVAINLRTKKSCQVSLYASTWTLFANGEKIQDSWQSLDAERFEFPVKLKAGNNEIIIASVRRGGFETISLGWSADSGIEMSPFAGSKHAAVQMICAGNNTADGALALGKRLTDNPASLEAAPSVPPSAGVQRGWVERSWDAAVPSFPLHTKKERVWAFDFAREILGRVSVEFDAPAGTVLIFTGSERLNPDGSVQNGFQLTKIQHRMIARGGRQTWLAMHPIGFRYLELAVIPAGKGEVTIHDVRAVRLKPHYEEKGRFLCSDAPLNQIWQLCRETQIVSLEDSYTDCPWRERGLYTGDQINQYFLNLAVFGDHTMMRNCINLFYQCQDSRGLVPGCTHGFDNLYHTDYTALSVESLWHYYSCTGDKEFVKERASQVELLLNGLLGLTKNKNGLFDATGLSPYIDLSLIGREGISLGINSFVCGAFRSGSGLFAAIGDKKRAKFWNDAHQKIRKTMRKTYLHDGLFMDRRSQDVKKPTPSAMGNTLAVYFGLAEEKEIPRIVDFICECALANAPKHQMSKSLEFHFSGYSSFYLLNVLYKYGRNLEAERFMRSEWRRMLDGGAWTCWEFFVPSNSLCHPWAASAGWFMTAYILGLRYAKPGDPDTLVFDPRPGTIEWAEGVFPHPRGSIRVAWKRNGLNLEAEITAPKGVKIIKAQG